MFIYTYTERESVCGLENEKRRMIRKNSILISGLTKYIVEKCIIIIANFDIHMLLLVLTPNYFEELSICTYNKAR